MSKPPEEKKGKRTKVPPPEDPTPKPDQAKPPAPEPVTGNAELEFDAAPVRISSDIREIATSGGVRKCKFSLLVEGVQGDPLSLGIAAAAHEIAKAASLIGDGKNSIAMSVARDFKTARYVLDPDGSGSGVEFIGALEGKLAVNVNSEGKITASWSLVTKVPIADFDRLCELKATMITLTVDQIQGSIVEDDDGQLTILDGPGTGGHR